MAEIVQYLNDSIELVLGGDYYETYNFFEDDEVTPLDTTDYGMELEIRKSFPNGELFDTLSVDNERIINTPVSGQFNISWLSTIITSYEFTSAQYRIVLIYPDGKRQVWRKGEIKVV